MRKITEYKQVTKEIITYAAYDGRIFDSESECASYEKTAECAIKGALNSLSPTIQYGEAFMDRICPFAWDCNWYKIKIDGVNDVEIVNRWIRFVSGENCNSIGKEAIGKEIIFEVTHDWIYPHGTAEELKAHFCREVDNFFG